MGTVTPLHRGAGEAFAEGRKVVPLHRIVQGARGEIVLVPMPSDEIEARLRAGSPNAPGRHIHIEPEPSWREIIYALAGAFAAGVLVWWVIV